jgi:steroid delta-isomerase-like uncharacterized protein
MNALLDQYLAAYNARDVDGMLATLTDDVVFENVSNAGGTLRLEGKAAFAAQARQAVTWFSERRQTPRHWVVGTDTAAVEIDYHGVLAVDLPNGLRAGQVLELRGVSVFEVRGGLICRLTDYS